MSERGRDSGGGYGATGHGTIKVAGRALVLVAGIAAAAIGFAAPVEAGPPVATVNLEDLTWTELRSRIQAGSTTVIVPLGGTEQNGPDIALGKHNARVKVLAGRIAAELGNAIVAPVVAYVPEGRADPPQQHMRFPGTITVPDDIFERLLESAARSFRVHGFRDIVLLGDHGGYQASEQRVADRLNHEWSSARVRVHAIAEYYDVTQHEYVAELRRRGYSETEIGTHAGLADAALALALTPELVRSERLANDVPSAALGEYGDPRRASAQLGSMGADLIVSHSVAAIRRAISRHADPGSPGTSQ